MIGWLIDRSIDRIIHWFIVALSSDDLLHNGEENWCSSLGVREDAVVIYQNWWHDERHYICQFPGKFYIWRFGLSLYYNCDSTTIRLRYDDTQRIRLRYESDRNYDMHSIRLWYDYDQKLTCSFFCSSRIASNGSRRARYVVVGSQSNRISGNVVGHINEIALRRAGLVLRWVTVRGYIVMVVNKATQANSAWPSLRGQA